MRMGIQMFLHMGSFLMWHAWILNIKLGSSRCCLTASLTCCASVSHITLCGLSYTTVMSAPRSPQNSSATICWLCTLIHRFCIKLKGHGPQPPYIIRRLSIRLEHHRPQAPYIIRRLRMQSTILFWRALQFGSSVPELATAASCCGR
jgi:hypothetical protein